MFTIEKNVQITDKLKKSGTIYPFKDMAVGDSFFVRGGADVLKKLRTRTRSAASNYSVRNNVKFSFRTMDDGFRVWRIA